MKEYIYQDNLENLNVSPSTSAQTFTPDNGYAYKSVNISPMPAGNIGDFIATVTAIDDNKITISPIVTAGTPGYNNMASIQGQPINIPMSNIVSGNVNLVDTHEYNVSRYATAKILDSNLTAENIKKNVNILGVIGQLETGIIPSGTLVITENGSYNVTNYSNANVEVAGGGGGNANIYLYSPEVVNGDKKVLIHSDCELSVPIDPTTVITSSNVTSFEQVDNLNLILNLDYENIHVGDVITFNLSKNSYRFKNGVASTVVKTVGNLTVNDTYESTVADPYKRDLVARMTATRYNSSLDEGYDTVQFTKNLPKFGFGRDGGNSVSVGGNSDIIITNGLNLKVGATDNEALYIWKEECTTVEDLDYFKIRWRGNDYGTGLLNQEWELVILSNGDMILRPIKMPDNSRDFYINGVSYNYSLSSPTCFYRLDKWGTAWSSEIGTYDLSKHIPAADDPVFIDGQFSNLCSTFNTGTKINTGEIDEDYVAVNLNSYFSWNNVNIFYLGGNSCIGVGTESESIKYNYNDSVLCDGCCNLYNLTDFNNLKSICLSWSGRSEYNGEYDRRWTLWLFENGDAMIYSKNIGNSQTGKNEFLGQLYTTAENSYISFYKNTQAGNYTIAYEVYTPEHHIG